LHCATAIAVQMAALVPEIMDTAIIIIIILIIIIIIIYIFYGNTRTVFKVLNFEGMAS
jgi:hypothetical protein